MLDPKDVEVVLSKLADGRRIARAVHLPTGIFVEHDATSEVIAELKDKQMKELEARVAAKERVVRDDALESLAQKRRQHKPAGQ